ncbi:MAG: alpha-amylase family glycosyl hydrolase [Muribaculaceae bacterium]
MLIIVGIAASVPAMGAAKSKLTVQHVHPAFWWSGMKNAELQVLIHGTGVGECSVELDGAVNVDLKEVVKPTNSNYVILYLGLEKAAPQTFNIVLKNGKKVLKKVPYELKQRDGRVFRSFDSSDVVYLLMPDRFANGNTANDNCAECLESESDVTGKRTRHGGDVAGIESRLDYLSDLGVTAIWTTPILENNMPKESFHGYAITNYYRVDPRYGTEEETKHFIETAHSKGIKYILDIVFNHCGSENFLFADRPADDWFHYNSTFVPTGYKTTAISDPNTTKAGYENTADGWFVKTMPDFNHQNRLVMDYLIQSSIWWIEWMHIDGIRQDTYPYNDFNQMARWCQAIEAEYPGFNIVGETWINNIVGCAYWQKDCKFADRNSYLPSVMDFPLMYALNYFADEPTNDWDKGLARIYEHLCQDRVYANPLNVMNMLGNHDTSRFVRDQELREKVYRYKQAFTLLATLRGIPQMYYGDEIGMVGNTGDGDWAVRRDFPGCQPGDAQNAFTEQGRDELQKQYFNFTRTLLQWRKGSKAVAYGSTKQYAVKNGVYVYARILNGEVATVVINGNDADVTVSNFAQDYSEVVPALSAYEVTTGKTVNLSGDLHLGSHEVMVLDFKK